MERRPSRAVEQAIAAAAAAGYTITAREFEDWRQVGLVPRASQHGLGRAKGSESRYTDEELEWVVAAAEISTQLGPLHERVCALFALEYPVDEQKLRAAYRRLLLDGEDNLDDPAAVDDAVDEFTHLVGRKSRKPQVVAQQRAVRQEIRDAATRAPASKKPTIQERRRLADQANATMARLVAVGEPGSTDELELVVRVALRRSGLDGMVNEEDLASSEFQQQFVESSDHLSVEAVIERLDTISYELLRAIAHELQVDPGPYSVVAIRPGQTPIGDQLVAPLVIAVSLEYLVSQGHSGAADELPSD